MIVGILIYHEQDSPFEKHWEIFLQAFSHNSHDQNKQQPEIGKGHAIDDTSVPSLELLERVSSIVAVPTAVHRGSENLHGRDKR